MFYFFFESIVCEIYHEMDFTRKRSSFIISPLGHEMNKIQKSHNRGPLLVLSCTGEPDPVYW